MKHDNIAKLYTFFEDKANAYLIIEYCEKGSLFHLLQAKRRFSEREAFHYFYQTCKGIDFLHKQNIIHRDLKVGF